ncbi:hypothetical protein HDK77DRAFT_20140 [Phyllosticta capitalensis]|uniref:Uncharacterized protein n=1 Tax=Phyllosticta capitalensis TaxID=121624 RepID=A0ABR1YZE5_9PEZI
MSTDSPNSFITAQEGDDTLYLTPPPTSHTPRTATAEPLLHYPHFYRPPKQLSFELSSHACIFLASGQYSEGLGLLKSLLTSGGSASSPSNSRPAFIPPTQIFELAATLAVHPSTTTRSSSVAKLRAANDALLYLRAVNRIVGPINAGFANAFTFPAPGSNKGRSRRRGFFESHNNDSRDDGKNTADSRPLNSALANDGGIWAHAEDFWHIVGWAFNCSVKQKARWSRWQVWLEVMLEIMEQDWKDRHKTYKQELEEKGVSSLTLLKQSIMATHLANCDAYALSSRRRILRAILADGSEKPLAEFKEVFKDELRERAKAKTAETINVADFKTGDLADLDALDPDEDEDLIEETTPPARKSSRSAAKADRRASIVSINSSEESTPPDNATAPVSEPFGPPAALALRVRLLSLISDITLTLPNDITTRHQMFDTYTEHLRPLPIASFTTMVSALAAHLPPATFCILAANTLLPLVANSPPAFDHVAPSQDEWEVFFLPIAASSPKVSDNAKVSFLLRSIVQVSLPDITWRRSWVEAVVGGVKARRDKIEAGKISGRARGRNQGRGDRNAEEVLRDSESALLMLAGWIEDDANVSSDQRPSRPKNLVSEPSAGPVIVDFQTSSDLDLSSVPSDEETPEIDMG